MIEAVARQSVQVKAITHDDEFPLESHIDENSARAITVRRQIFCATGAKSNHIRLRGGPKGWRIQKHEP
jgi:hypothetical protein